MVIYDDDEEEEEDGRELQDSLKTFCESFGFTLLDAEDGDRKFWRSTRYPDPRVEA